MVLLSLLFASQAILVNADPLLDKSMKNQIPSKRSANALEGRFCNEIKTDCIRSGFRLNQGGKSGNDLWLHCMKPILDGVAQKKVTGIRDGLIIPIPPPEFVKGCIKEKPEIKNLNEDCHLIVSECETSGFAQAKSKEGYDLWTHCVNPIVQGVAEKDVKNLKSGYAFPKIPAAKIASCVKGNKRFGKGRVGT